MPEHFILTILELHGVLEHLHGASFGVRKGCTRVDLVFPPLLGLQRPLGSLFYTLVCDQRHSLVYTT